MVVVIAVVQPCDSLRPCSDLGDTPVPTIPLDPIIEVPLAALSVHEPVRLDGVPPHADVPHEGERGRVDEDQEQQEELD